MWHSARFCMQHCVLCRWNMVIWSLRLSQLHPVCCWGRHLTTSIRHVTGSARLTAPGSVTCLQYHSRLDACWTSAKNYCFCANILLLIFRALWQNVHHYVAYDVIICFFSSLVPFYKCFFSRDTFGNLTLTVLIQKLKLVILVVIFDDDGDWGDWLCSSVS